MYYLMNKDNISAVLKEDTENIFSDSLSLNVEKICGKIPIGFRNINTWIDGRKASKHNSHLQKIMRQMGCDDNREFIKITHAATINDTFWIKSDKENISWKQVSLYQNQFTEVISKLAFEGVGLYDAVFSSTSPELACDGSFRKCFRKEKYVGEFGSDIFLYKRGGEIGAGFEPYCESMASEIAKFISNDAVSYNLVTLHGKLASQCNLFTNEKYGYAQFAKVADMQELDLKTIFDYFSKIGSEQEFREMLVIDSLCFNQDRHAGNYGVLFDTDTLGIIKMSPVFDLNISLFPYVEDEDFSNIGDILFEYSPKLGDDFTRIGQMGLNDKIRDKVKDMCDFSFKFRGDDKFLPERVKCIESIVRKQAKAILSKEKLQTKDVFFSEKERDYAIKKEQSEKAALNLEKFMKLLDDMHFGENIFISECCSTDTVQCYIEKDSLMVTVDFLENSINAAFNCKSVSDEKLKEIDNEFYNSYIDICNKFKEVEM